MDVNQASRQLPGTHFVPLPAAVSTALVVVCVVVGCCDPVNDGFLLFQLLSQQLLCLSVTSCQPRTHEPSLWWLAGPGGAWHVDKTRVGPTLHQILLSLVFIFTLSSSSSVTHSRCCLTMSESVSLVPLS